MASPPDDDARFDRPTVRESPSAGSRPSRNVVASPFDPPSSRERFEEGAELGRGGMGRVFEARDVVLDRAVAIKQSLTDDAEMLVRFEREALITAQLQHPGIVPVLDAGRDAHGRPYYVMRKIEGRPLATVVSEARTVGARLALLPNMLAAVDAVAYAHARGVIHRDLKPWNILLGPFGETFVIDWGLARDLAADDTDGGSTSSGDDGLTRVGSALGTPGFMAPEQARGEPLDRRADVYALGATLVHLLAGAQPFAGIEPTVAIEAAARDEAPRVEFPDEVPAELRAIAMKAMTPGRDARYRDAGELASDLRRFLAGQLVAAHAYTRRERLARWLRKHRLAVAITTVATIALAVISTVAIRRVVIARDAARTAQERAAERADAMLVERAYSLATTDPAYALALLKQLSPTSSAWSRAQTVAETAAAAGVGWGHQLARVQGWARVDASPSGDAIAVSSFETLYLGDPSLQTPPRVVMNGHGVLAQLGWLDDDTLIVGTDKNGILRVGRDGSVRSLQTNGQRVTLLTPVDARRVFARVDGRLRELDPAGGPPLADLGPVDAGERVGGGLVYQVGEQLVVHVDGRDPVTVPGYRLDHFRVTANLALGRLALFDVNTVIELAFDGAAWKERARWLVGADHLVYRGATLIAVESVGIAYLWPGQPPMRASMPISRTRALVAGAVAEAKDGVFIAGDHAVYALVTGQPAAIAPFTDPLFAFAKAGPYLFGITRTGMMRSWDLRKILPQRIAIKQGAECVAVDADHAWFTANGLLVPFDFATGKVGAPIGHDDTIESSYMCAGAERTIVRLDARRRIAFHEPAELVVVDRAGKLTPIPGDFVDAMCSLDARHLALVSTTAVEVRDAMHPDRPGRTWSTAKPIRLFTVTPNWLAMLDDAGELTRVELATGDQTRLSVDADLEAFAIDPRGRIATVKGGAIEVWIDGKRHAVATGLDVSLISAHDIGFIVSTRDRAIVTIDVANRVSRFDVGEAVLSLARDAPRAAIIVDGKLAMLDLRDGDIVRFPWAATSAAISPDGRMLTAVVFGSESAGAVRTQVPRDPREILRWLDRTTNATLEPGSTELTWK